jgi:hypothetical protein
MLTPDEWVSTPADRSPTIGSGRGYDRDGAEGGQLWRACLERAARQAAVGWVVEAMERERSGTPMLITTAQSGELSPGGLDAYG